MIASPDKCFAMHALHEMQLDAQPHAIKNLKRIRERNWPSKWFYTTENNGKPYIYYLSYEFIQHCLKTIDDMLSCVGAIEKEK